MFKVAIRDLPLKLCTKGSYRAIPRLCIAVFSPTPYNIFSSVRTQGFTSYLAMSCLVYLTLLDLREEFLSWYSA